jgi:hypothetical protein
MSNWLLELVGISDGVGKYVFVGRGVAVEGSEVWVGVALSRGGRSLVGSSWLVTGGFAKQAESPNPQQNRLNRICIFRMIDGFIDSPLAILMNDFTTYTIR